LRYSTGETEGTARFKSMSGAFGALGGDMSAVSINPAGSAIFNTGEAYNIGRRALPDNPHYNYIRKTDYCSGYCLLVKRLMPDLKMVQLDEHFMPAYYEETDLCMQLRHNYNLNTYYQPFARLIHFESISYGKEKNSKKQRLIDINQEKFKQKWKVQLVESHIVKPKKYKDYNDLRLKNKSIIYLEDSLEENTLETIYKQREEGYKVAVLIKSKGFLEANVITDLQRIGIEVLYPYYTSKGKVISYFKIYRNIIAVYSEVKTKNIFYKTWFYLKK